MRRVGGEGGNLRVSCGPDRTQSVRDGGGPVAAGRAAEVGTRVGAEVGPARVEGHLYGGGVGKGGWGKGAGGDQEGSEGLRIRGVQGRCGGAAAIGLQGGDCVAMPEDRFRQAAGAVVVQESGVTGDLLGRPDSPERSGPPF